MPWCRPSLCQPLGYPRKPVFHPRRTIQEVSSESQTSRGLAGVGQTSEHSPAGFGLWRSFISGVAGARPGYAQLARLWLSQNLVKPRGTRGNAKASLPYEIPARLSWPRVTCLHLSSRSRGTCVRKPAWLDRLPFPPAIGVNQCRSTCHAPMR